MTNDQEDSMTEPITSVSGSVGDTAGNTTNGGKKPDRETEYLVFEAPSPVLEDGDTLTFLGTFTAANKPEARWAAVDDIPDVKERVEVQEGEEGGGVYLLAVAARHATPERTVEEIVKTRVRR